MNYYLSTLIWIRRRVLSVAFLGFVVACSSSKTTPTDSATGGGANEPADGGTGSGSDVTAGSHHRGGTTNAGGGTTNAPGGVTSKGGATGNGGVYAVIIKAAGYVDQAGPDTLSSATTEPYNTHVFADALAQHLSELDVNVSVVSWVDCDRLSCLRVPNAKSTASIVVFAGSTYNGELPVELQDFIPTLASFSPAPKVASALTSCNQVPGDQAFVTTLAAAKIPTVSGVAPQAESKSSLTDAEMHALLTAFAKRLVEAL